jgi:putative alpha-1,2-mannosidase
MWDTYRALHPLLCIIAPEETAQMMQSLVGMYEEGGWLPIFPCWNSYTAAMIGDHCTSVLTDAWAKGIRGFDGKKAYEAMRKNALQQPATIEEYKNGMGRRALRSYMKYGYIPLEDPVTEAFHQQEQTSRTLEYAYDDFCVAQMARMLAATTNLPPKGKAIGAEVSAVSGGVEVPAVSEGLDYSADYRLLMARSENWRNVINPGTGYADGRHADGRWEGNTDLVHRQPYITEGATCHYTWYVPHNIPGLIELMGGKEKFTEKLDSMFTEGRYWHGNEPCHQVPWLFTLAGHPEKTRQWVRHIIETEYNDTPGGLSGNDDAGQMSAWFIFACLGFYPVCPGTPEYVTSAPLFRRITINPPGGEPMVFNADDELPPVITLSPQK